MSFSNKNNAKKGLDASVNQSLGLIEAEDKRFFKQTIFQVRWAGLTGTLDATVVCSQRYSNDDDSIDSVETYTIDTADGVMTWKTDTHCTGAKIEYFNNNVSSGTIDLEIVVVD
jgi:hypothetical protein